MRLSGSYAVKLVRDGYQQVTNRLEIRFRKLRHGDHESALRVKLLEECGEYIESKDIYELADIYECVRALAWVSHRKPMREIEAMADAKLEERGSFMNGIAMFAEPVRPAGEAPSRP